MIFLLIGALGFLSLPRARFDVVAQATILVGIIAAFRGNGGDLDGYSLYFLEIPELSQVSRFEFLPTRWLVEIGFTLWTSVIKTVLDNFQFYIFANAFLITSLSIYVCRIAKHHSSEMLSMVFVYISVHSFFLFQFHYTRQAIASLFFCLIFLRASLDNHKWNAGLGFLACTIHLPTGILSLIISIYFKVRSSLSFSRKIILFFLPLCFVFILNYEFDNYFAIFLKSYQRYLETSETLSISSFAMLKVVVVLLLLCDAFIRKNYRLLVVSYVCVLISTIFVPYISRFLITLDFIAFFLLAIWVERLRLRELKLAVKAFIVIVVMSNIVVQTATSGNYGEMFTNYKVGI